MPLDTAQRQGVTGTNLFPSSQRLSLAARNALVHPATWGPLAGAALFAIKDFDQQVSQNLYDNQPVFGSTQQADARSDTLRDILLVSTVASTLALPANASSPGGVDKTTTVAVESAAFALTGAVTSSLKNLTQRNRPDNSDHNSFPSGHSAFAFAAAALTSRNLDGLALDDGTRTGIRAGLYTLAAGTAWARVEAGAHYPSDVLVGAALGNFLARFIHGAYFGWEHNLQLNINVSPNYRHIAWQWPFW